MATKAGEIYFDIKFNKSSFNTEKAKLNKDASKAGNNLGALMGNQIGSSLSRSISGLGSKLSPAFGKVGATLGASLATSMGTAIAAVPVAGWILAAVGAIGALTVKVSNFGDEIDKNSQKMGISADGYQRWGYVLQRCGSNIESMKPAMKKLAIEAQKNSSAFQQLGISQEEVASMNTEQLFGRTITALQGVKSQTERLYLASKLLSKGSVELGAVFNTSADETQRWLERVDYLGGVMSNKGVKNCAALRDAIGDLKVSFKGFGNMLAEYIAPVITWLINNVFIPFIVTLRKAWQAVFNFFRGLGQLVSDVLGKIPGGNKIKEFFGNLTSKRTSVGLQNTAEGMEDVSTGVSDTGSNAKKAKKEVNALKRELMGFDKITKLQGENKGTSSDTGTTNTSGTDGGIGGLDTSSMFDTSELDQQSETWYQKLKKTLKEKWTKLKADVKQAIQDFWKWVDETVGGWWDKHFGGKTFEIELPTWPDLKKKIDTLLGNFWETIRKGAAKLGIELPTWPELKAQLDSLLGKFWERIRGGAKKLGIDLPTWPELKAQLDSLLGRLWERFRQKRDGKISITLPKWADLKQGWNDLMSKFKGKKAEVKLSVKTIIDKAWNSLARKFNDLKAAHPIIMKAFPKLPYLASGGFVKANTPQLAVIGDNKREGEIVAPESKLAAMAAQAANSGNEEMISLLRAILATLAAKDTNVYLDGEEIKNNVVNRINRHTRSTGQLEIII